jgi:Putative zinc-finger
VPVHPVHPDPEQLAAWQAGELRGRESARIKAHLADCAECAGTVAAVERGRSAVDRLAEPDLPAGLHERLAVAIERERVAAAEVVGNGARHGGQEGAPVGEPVPLDPRRAARQHRAHRAHRPAGVGADDHRPRRRRAALLSTAAALVLLVGGLFPLIRHITEGSGSTQTASGAASAPQSRAPGRLTAGGSAAVPVFSAPGGYSADALRSALQSDPQARAAYDQAVTGTNDRSAAGGGGSGQPSTVEPFTKESNGAAADAGGAVTSGVPQATCVSAARDQAGDQSLRPAFFINTVYQGRSATVLVTVRPGAANQADLWAFPRGNCSAPPFAHAQVTVPAR